jgi:hypothetical protein
VRPDVVVAEVCKDRTPLLIDPESTPRAPDTWTCSRVVFDGLPDGKRGGGDDDEKDKDDKDKDKEKEKKAKYAKEPDLEAEAWPAAADLAPLLRTRIGAAVTTSEVEGDVAALEATGLFASVRPLCEGARRGDAPMFGAVKSEGGGLELEYVAPLGCARFVVAPRKVPAIKSLAVRLDSSLKARAAGRPWRVAARRAALAVSCVCVCVCWLCVVCCVFCVLCEGLLLFVCDLCVCVCACVCQRVVCESTCHLGVWTTLCLLAQPPICPACSTSPPPFRRRPRGHPPSCACDQASGVTQEQLDAVAAEAVAACAADPPRDPLLAYLAVRRRLLDLVSGGGRQQHGEEQQQQDGEQQQRQQQQVAEGGAAASDVVVEFSGVLSGAAEAVVRARRPGGGDAPFVSGLEASAEDDPAVERFRPAKRGVLLSPRMSLPAEAAARMNALRAARRAEAAMTARGGGVGRWAAGAGPRAGPRARGRPAGGQGRQPWRRRGRSAAARPAPRLPARYGRSRPTCRSRASRFQKASPLPPSRDHPKPPGPFTSGTGGPTRSRRQTSPAPSRRRGPTCWPAS